MLVTRRAKPAGGAALLDLCVDLERLRSEVTALEVEWRQHTRPACRMRRPPPRLVTRVASAMGGADGAAQRLLEIARRATALMSDGVCRCDVGEWVEAKVSELQRRASVNRGEEINFTTPSFLNPQRRR